MTRIPIWLSDNCLIAIRTLAKQECRDVRQQVAWIVEQELKHRGLLVLETRTDLDPTCVDILRISGDKESV